MQDATEEARERTPGKARAQRTQVVNFSDLGESVERVHHTLEKHGDGTWEHYPERIAVEPLDEKLIREEEHARLQAGLDRLPPEDRELITQRYGIEGPPQTFRELARARGCTPEAVRLRIETIKKRLKRRLLRMKSAG